MSEFYYENQGAGTFLVYELKDEDSIDEVSLGMLTNNDIPGLAQTIFTQMDDTRFLKFNVSSKVPVTQFFSGTVSRKAIIGVFRGAALAMVSAEEYMLESSAVMLDPEYIFADVSSGKAELICLPLLNKEGQKANLGEFLRNIIFKIRFDPSENCDYVARIINYLNSTPVISPAGFLDFLKEIEAEASGTKPAGAFVSASSKEPQRSSSQVPEQVPERPQVNNPAPAVQNPSAFAQPNIPSPAPAPGSSVMVQAPLPAANIEPDVKFGMAIPNSAKKSTPNVPEDTEEEISFMYLMQHYNKENAAAYKAQKERKKQAQNGGADAPAAAAPDSKKKKESAKADKKKEKKSKKGAEKNADLGFAYPGQQPSLAQPGNGYAQPDYSQQQAPYVQPGYAQQQVPYARPVQPAPAQNAAFPQPDSYQNPGYNPQPSWEPDYSYEETSVLDESEAGEFSALPHLIRVKSGDKITIDKAVFKLGKEKSYVDYCITDNSAVSRSHANIISRDGRYFIIDTNSTNHTYLNGRILQSSSEAELHHGDKIRLANEDFVFNLY